MRGVQRLRLFGQQRGVAPADQRLHRITLGRGGQQPERLGADAAGAAENAHGLHCHNTTPRPSHSASSAASGAAASSPSSRSSRPPWPGISAPESLAPTMPLHRTLHEVACLRHEAERRARQRRPAARREPSHTAASQPASPAAPRGPRPRPTRSCPAKSAARGAARRSAGRRDRRRCRSPRPRARTNSTFARPAAGSFLSQASATAAERDIGHARPPAPRPPARATGAATPARARVPITITRARHAQPPSHQPAEGERPRGQWRRQRAGADPPSVRAQPGAPAQPGRAPKRRSRRANSFKRLRRNAARQNPARARRGTAARHRRPARAGSWTAAARRSCAGSRSGSGMPSVVSRR